jgi:hypothetical protein
VNGWLGLAADFIDRLANPVHGIAVNESYGARLGELIAADPELTAALAGGHLEAADATAMSTPSWLWYLAWRRSSGLALPPESFMDALFDRTTDTVVRLKLVELAATDPTVSSRERAANLEDLPDSWLKSRLRRLAAGESEAPFREAQELTVMLLQIGSPFALESLKAFLAGDGRVQRQARADADQTLTVLAANNRQVLASWRESLGLFRSDNF